MRFFGTRLPRTAVLLDDNRAVFVASSDGLRNGPRLWTAYVQAVDGSITTLAEYFRHHRTRAEALAAMRAYITQEASRD